MNITPIEIKIDLLTPLIYADAYPLHLDGLLFWAIYQFCDSEKEALDRLDLILDKTADVYRASQALFVKSKTKSISVDSFYRGTRADWADYAEGFSKAKKSIKEKEGPFRRRFDEFSAINVAQLIFYANGDSEKVEYFLKTITGIGRQANAGFGEIEKIQVMHVSEDSSWFLDGKLNRVLPTKAVSTPLPNPVRAIRYKPNYTSSAIDNCYLPLTSIVTK